MTPKTIRKELYDHNKGKAFISLNALRLWLGIGQNKAVDLCEGLNTFDSKYFIPDVAERICERTVLR